MKIKKYGISLILIVSLLLALASCRIFEKDGDTGDDGLDAGASTDTDSSEAPSGALWSPKTVTTIVLADGVNVNPYLIIDPIYAATGRVPRVASASSEPLEHEIVIGNTERPLSKRAYRYLEESVGYDEEYAGWCILADGGSIAIAYDRDMSASVAIEYFIDNWCGISTVTFEDGVVAKGQFKVISYINEKRDEAREEGLDALTDTLGEGTVTALKALFSLYDEDMYLWMANLYDPDVGGFYFSNSARDNIGFLPDIESTVQILNFLESSGMLVDYGGSYGNGIPASVREQLVNFAIGLQSLEDGYFYHPQWGKNIINARRGRDLGWATQMLKKFGEKPLYNTPDGVAGALGAPPGVAAVSSLTARLGETSVTVAVSKIVPAARSNLPEFLQSMDAWKKYIDELGINEDSYTAGNDLAAMHTQIVSAGKEYVDYVVDYLNKTQDTSTGLWEPKWTDYQGERICSYNAINGLFKISHFYYYMSATIPNAEIAIESVIDVVLQDWGDTHVCSIYNPWITFDLLLDSLAETDGAAKVAELREILIANSEALVRSTYEKIADYKEDDGGFSYRGNVPQLTSQKAVVACATTPESDVNATCISSTGIVLNIFDTLGVRRVPLYTSADFFCFLKELEDMGTIVKNEPDPVVAETFDGYEDGSGEEEFGVVKYPAANIENTFTDTTVTNGAYRYYQSDVVDDPRPKDSSDKALMVTTRADGDDCASNPLYTFIGVSNSFLTGNCYKFSTDIMVNAGSGSFMQLLFSRAMGAAYDSFGLDFQIYESGNTQYIRIADHKAGPDGESDNNLADGIPLGEWVNIAVEVYKIYSEPVDGKKSVSIVGKIFLNGEYVGISEASRVENGEVVDIAIGAVTVAHSRKSNNVIYLDNVMAERTNDAYTAESPLFPVKPENVPSYIPELSGEHIGGEYYNGKTDGKHYSYDNGEKAPSTSKRLEAKTYITDEKYVYYYRTGGTSVHEAITYSYLAPSADAIQHATVFEADMAFGGASVNNFLLLRLCGLGKRASVYLNATADGERVEFRNAVYSTDSAVLAQNTWYNIRIEAYALENNVVRFKIYVDGEFVAELDGLDVSNNDKNCVDIQIQYTDPDSYVAYDNVWLGYTDSEYAEPPGIAGPELSGTKGNGEYYGSDAKGNVHNYDALGATAPSTKLPDLSEVTEGKYVWYHKGGSDNTSITYSFSSAPSDRTANVIEFDAAFGGLDENTTFLRVLMQSAVCRADMYLKTDADGKVFISGNPIVAGENISIEQGVWHNFRLEYSLSEEDVTLVNVKLFVDNEWQCDMQFSCGSVGNERVLFYLQGKVDYYMCIDNVYTGYKNTAFVSGDNN